MRSRPKHVHQPATRQNLKLRSPQQASLIASHSSMINVIWRGRVPLGKFALVALAHPAPPKKLPYLAIYLVPIENSKVTH